MRAKAIGSEATASIMSVCPVARRAPASSPAPERMAEMTAPPMPMPVPVAMTAA